MLKPEGTLVIDAGAAKALSEGKSLLPAGVRQIDGRFERGDAVLVKDQSGREIARGLAAYGAGDAERIAGKRSLVIEAILGYSGRDESVMPCFVLPWSQNALQSSTLHGEMLALGRRARDAAQAARSVDAVQECAQLRRHRHPHACRRYLRRECEG